MPNPANVRYLPQAGYQPQAHGLEVFATLTAKAVIVVVIALFAFTLGITARSVMDLPRMGVMQTAILEMEGVCRDIAQGAKFKRKGG